MHAACKQRNWKIFLGWNHSLWQLLYFHHVITKTHYRYPNYFLTNPVCLKTRAANFPEIHILRKFWNFRISNPKSDFGFQFRFRILDLKSRSGFRISDPKPDFGLQIRNRVSDFRFESVFRIWNPSDQSQTVDVSTSVPSSRYSISPIQNFKWNFGTFTMSPFWIGLENNKTNSKSQPVSHVTDKSQSKFYTWNFGTFTMPIYRIGV